MPSRYIASITAAGLFKSDVPEREIRDVLSKLEAPTVDGTLALRDETADRFAMLCDLRLQQLMRAQRRFVPSLRAESGGGWRNHKRKQYEFVCEIGVNADFLDSAKAVVMNVEFSHAFHPLLVSAAKEFAVQNRLDGLFDEYWASYYLNPYALQIS